MVLQSPSTSIHDSILVLDASAAINLLGTGLTSKFLNCLSKPTLIESHALKEIRRHPIPGQDHEITLTELNDAGLFQRVQIGDDALTIFQDLVSGRFESTLDDGEAATIAYAVCHSDSAIPVIDEKKATRIFRKYWPTRKSITTTGLIRDFVDLGLVPKDIAKEAIKSALLHARMRIPPVDRDWVIEMIGHEEAATFPSLGNRSRSI